MKENLLSEVLVMSSEIHFWDGRCFLAWHFATCFLGWKQKVARHFQWRQHWKLKFIVFSKQQKPDQNCTHTHTCSHKRQALEVRGSSSLRPLLTRKSFNPKIICAKKIIHRSTACGGGWFTDGKLCSLLIRLDAPQVQREHWDSPQESFRSWRLRFMFTERRV